MRQYTVQAICRSVNKTTTGAISRKYQLLPEGQNKYHNHAINSAIHTPLLAISKRRAEGGHMDELLDSDKQLWS